MPDKVPFGTAVYLRKFIAEFLNMVVAYVCYACFDCLVNSLGRLKLNRRDKG